MSRSVGPYHPVKKNVLTSLGLKLRDKILLLNKYKNLSSDGESNSEFKFLENEVGLE